MSIDAGSKRFMHNQVSMDAEKRFMDNFQTGSPFRGTVYRTRMPSVRITAIDNPPTFREEPRKNLQWKLFSFYRANWRLDPSDSQTLITLLNDFYIEAHGSKAVVAGNHG